MVGYRSGKFEFPIPTHGPDSNSDSALVTVSEAIADLQDPSEKDHDDLGGLYGHRLPLVPRGLNYSFFTREMGYPEPIFAWRSKFHDFLHKVDPNFPSRTIKAKPGKFTGPFHWKNRHFTVEELKRLQSFPDEYAVVGNFGRIVEQIGNSVPPLLAQVIAVSAREQLLDRTKELTYPKRPAAFSSTFRLRQRERSNHFKAVAKRVIGERFRIGGEDKLGARKKKSQTRYGCYDGFFGKKILDRRPTKRKMSGRLFKRASTFEGDEIKLIVDRLYGGTSRRRRIKIEIGGLHAGLTSIRRLTAYARVTDLHDIFFFWDAIGDVLVLNSKFLTLIDIYGHYANRGDTVTIQTDIIGGSSSVLVRALRFFGDSAHCGEAVARAEVCSVLNIPNTELDKLISDMRAMRFDIRTRATHPTIAPGMVLCTYPFPLLSGKAHLERRLKAESFEPEATPLWQANLFN